MVTLSISSGLISDMKFPTSMLPFVAMPPVPTATPSITYKGCADADEFLFCTPAIEVAPRITTKAEEVGSALKLVMLTPVILPSRFLRKFDVPPNAISFEFTSSTAYPRAFFSRLIPIAVTTISSRATSSDSITIFISVDEPTTTVLVFIPTKVKTNVAFSSFTETE